MPHHHVALLHQTCLMPSEVEKQDVKMTIIFGGVKKKRLTHVLLGRSSGGGWKWQ